MGVLHDILMCLKFTVIRCVILMLFTGAYFHKCSTMNSLQQVKQKLPSPLNSLPCLLLSYPTTTNIFLKFGFPYLYPFIQCFIFCLVFCIVSLHPWFERVSWSVVNNSLWRMNYVIIPPLEFISFNKFMLRYSLKFWSTLWVYAKPITTTKKTKQMIPSIIFVDLDRSSK